MTTVNVPTDQATVQGALDHLGPGVTGEVRIESGHEIETPVLLEGGDWSRVTITSDDAQVPVGAAFSGAEM